MGKFDEFINQLSAQTGLHKDVIAAWVQREQGVNNNVLGITSNSAKTAQNPHGLATFKSQTAAANATATLLQVSSNYAGIRATYGGTSQEQALAIAQSPWHLGATGLKNAGGTDPYYYNGFVQAGILKGSAPTTGINKPKQGKATDATSTGGTTGGINIDPVGAVNDALTAPLKAVSDALASPLYFLGIVGIGATLLLVGGLILAKPAIEKAAPLAAAAA